MDVGLQLLDVGIDLVDAGHTPSLGQRLTCSLDIVVCLATREELSRRIGGNVLPDSCVAGLQYASE